PLKGNPCPLRCWIRQALRPPRKVHPGRGYGKRQSFRIPAALPEPAHLPRRWACPRCSVPAPHTEPAIFSSRSDTLNLIQCPAPHTTRESGRSCHIASRPDTFLPGCIVPTLPQRPEIRGFF